VITVAHHGPGVRGDLGNGKWLDTIIKGMHDLLKQERASSSSNQSKHATRHTEKTSRPPLIVFRG